MVGLSSLKSGPDTCPLLRGVPLLVSIDSQVDLRDRCLDFFSSVHIVIKVTRCLQWLPLFDCVCRKVRK